MSDCETRALSTGLSHQQFALLSELKLNTVGQIRIVYGRISVDKKSTLSDAKMRLLAFFFASESVDFRSHKKGLIKLRLYG